MPTVYQFQSDINSSVIGIGAAGGGAFKLALLFRFFVGLRISFTQPSWSGLSIPAVSTIAVARKS